MPKLSRAQREAREARRATITSKTDQSSPSSTAIQTSPSALLTNQPIQTNTSSKKSSSSKQNSTAGAGGSNTNNKNGKEFRKSSSHTRSPSTTTERIPSMQQLPGSRIRNTDYFPQQAGSPPGFAASDVSTSEESQDETMNAGEISTSKANISLMDEHADGDEDELMGEPASVGGEDNPEVKCMWEDCGEVFNSLIDFINHLHDEHVGIHRARYSCEWSGCPRKGKAQTSRFALLSHLRSHTGEKPFTCPRPECDKSFTRSDALAKHMRVQHNINPVTSRGKSSTSATATAQLGMYGRQHGGKNRGEASGLGGEEEDWLEEGTGRGKSADVLGEELLELAEGEANGSLADVEHSLMMHGSKSPFFTYDNLFGAGSRALANLNGGSSKSIAIQPASTKEISIPDEELGIVRDHEYSIGISANDETRDEEAITRSEEMITKVLEQGRREWIRRERESAELRPDPEPILSKRDQIDYLSDEDPDDSKTYKRARRSSTRNAQMKAQGISDVVNLKRLYIIEKAKLRFIRQENKRMRMYLEDLRQIEKDELRQKRILLEQALEAELGKDVGAIFSPPASPQSQRR